MLRSQVPAAFGILFVILFILNGISVIPYPGLQNDEAFFSAPLYDPTHAASVLRVFGRPVPLMHLSYLGTLKTWAYAPVVRLWPPGSRSVRLASLSIGASTIVLFFLLVRRVAGVWAAMIGSGLLAADPVFLLTTLFDWGPVALHLLLTVGGCCCLVRFAQTGSRVSLSVGFLLFGLALWHKAVFVWTLAALLIGALLTLRTELARSWTRRNATLAGLWFCIGSFPFLRYNIQQPLATFRENAAVSVAAVGAKARVMMASLDGSGLFGYMVWEDPVAQPLPPETLSERISYTVSELAGRPRHTPLPWLLAAGIALIPLLWSSPVRRPVIFGLCVLSLSWAAMVCSSGGGALHHTVLVWPWPHLLVGAAFAGLAGRFRWAKPLVAAATVTAVVSGHLVINQYRTQFFRNGPKHAWTNAIFPLASLLSRQPAGPVVLIDWGMLDNLRLLTGGKLPLLWASAPLLKPSPGDSDRREVRRLLGNPGHVFVAHTEDHEQFPGVNERLRRISEEEGFRKELMYVVRDRHGRAVFEVFRFRPAAT